MEDPSTLETADDFFDERLILQSDMLDGEDLLGRLADEKVQ